MTKSAKFFVTFLFILVILSLALNGFIIWQLLMARQQAQQAARDFGGIVQESLNRTISDLEGLESSSVEFTVAVDQDFPIDTAVDFNETIEVPIQMTVPISQTIETVIFLEVVGGVEVPVEIAVPVNVEVPIDNTVAIPLERTIPISAVVPLRAEVPIEIDVGESDLAGQVVRLRQDLQALSDVVERLLGAVEP